MSFKQKSRLPMPINTLADAESDQCNKMDSARSTSSMTSASSRSKPTAINPLAKAMEKRPKKDRKGKSGSETWYDEKVESQSQLRYQKTKTGHEKRKEELMKQLKEAEDKLEVMKNLLEERDKLLKDAQEDAENKVTSLEEKLDEREKALFNNGIDPVTGQPVMLSQEEKMRRKNSEKFTKKKIQGMREKLMEMNKDTESYLADIENTMQYLDSLELSSERMGPLSEETRRYFGDFDNEEDIIAKVYDENKAPSSKTMTSQLPKDTERDKDEDVQDTDSVEDNDEEEVEKSRFFITHPDALNRSSPME